MEILEQIAQKIIEQQETIIGPVAIEQAKRVSGLTIDWPKHKVTFSGDATKAVDELVQQYEHLFGQLSVEVCRDVTVGLVTQLPPDKQPKMLKP